MILQVLQVIYNQLGVEDLLASCGYCQQPRDKMCLHRFLADVCKYTARHDMTTAAVYAYLGVVCLEVCQHAAQGGFVRLKLLCGHNASSLPAQSILKHIRL